MAINSIWRPVLRAHVDERDGPRGCRTRVIWRQYTTRQANLST